jgi:hypothetical protein
MAIEGFGILDDAAFYQNKRYTPGRTPLLVDFTAFFGGFIGRKDG